MQEPTEIKYTQPLSYRPDIDGLRALAVLVVVAFHAFPSVIPGGYVGVDIFFVISGFLITSILLKDIDRGAHSVKHFYSRRIKRIFPALVLVLAASLFIGWAILLPDEIRSLGNNTFAASFFVSNFWLWHEAGYFDPVAELKPLLHLWSLAIEEQFYIVWPLMLFLLCRVTRRVALLIAVLALVSWVSCVSSINDHVTMFYFPQNRAWELLAGAVLASLHRERIRRNGPADYPGLVSCWNVLSCVGVFTIAVTILVLDKKSIFPGWLALSPVLAAAVIIHAGERAWINRYVFSSRIAVFVGLISYPLYLWHWPLLAFTRMMEGSEPSAFKRGVCVAISVLLAWLTYRFLELPLRRGGVQVVRGLVMMALAIGVTGYLFGAGSLKPRAAYYHLDSIVNALTDFGWPKTNYTTIKFGNAVFDSRGEGVKATIFIGDSNMQQFLPRIDLILGERPDAYNRVIFAAFGACAPVMGTKKPDEPGDVCPAVIRSAYQLALSDPDIDTVVIAASWVTYFGALGTGWYYDDQGKHYALSGPGSDGVNKAIGEMESTILKLQHAGKKVYLILNIPQGDEFDPRGQIKRSWSDLNFGLDNSYKGVPRATVEDRQEPIISGIRDMARRTGVTVFDPVDLFCSKKVCPVFTTDGYPIYKDYNHVNASFAKKYATFIDQTVIRH